MSQEVKRFGKKFNLFPLLTTELNPIQSEEEREREREEKVNGGMLNVQNVIHLIHVTCQPSKSHKLTAH